MSMEDLKKKFMRDMSGYFWYDWKHRSEVQKEIIKRLVECHSEERDKLLNSYSRNEIDDLIRGGYIICEEGKYKLVPAFIEGTLDKEVSKKEPLPESHEPPEEINSLLRRMIEIEGKIRKDYKQRVTVMFTDIVGSTEYFAKKGDIAGRAMVQRHNDLLFPIIDEYQGKIIKTIGDAIMAGFDKADDGVSAGIKMQEALAKYNQNRDDEIHIRIGIHTGKAIKEPNDTYGDTVNTAARVEALACGDQILISEATKDEFKKEFNLHLHGDYPLKGIPREIPIYEVLWYERQMSKKPDKKEMQKISDKEPKKEQEVKITGNRNIVVQTSGNVVITSQSKGK